MAPTRQFSGLLGPVFGSRCKDKRAPTLLGEAAAVWRSPLGSSGAENRTPGVVFAPTGERLASESSLPRRGLLHYCLRKY